MNHSPLLSAHETAGARCAERPSKIPGSDASSVVLTFGDVPAEYAAAHSGCALFDSTERGLIAVKGEDSASFLHGLLANEVRSIAPGKGNSNLLLSAKGKVQFGFDLLRDDGEILCASEPGEAAALIAALDMYHFVEQVEFEDRSEGFAPLSLRGSKAKSVIEELVGPLPAMQDHDHIRRDWNGTSLRIISLEVAGSEGFQADAGAEHVLSLWTALTKAGATPTGQVVLDILRIEAGRAAHGVDITDDIYPQEAQLDRSFSLDKGCYIGQEVVAKIDTYGGLNKQTRVLRVSHDDPVAAGTPLLFTEDGETRKLGVVTSWAYSFALDTGVVLAYVKRKHQDTGNTFSLGEGEATIVDTPLAV